MAAAAPAADAQSDPGRCRSLKRTLLHREGDIEVYIRCVGRDGHDSANHRSWIRKWKDDTEDGWIEDEYDG